MKLNQFDISVIIPVYNTEMFIREALDSVLHQTFKGRVEIIVIDDCSTDGTVAVLEQYKQEHPECRMEILLQEKNMRQGTARNRGIKQACGKYVFFLDGDDTLDLLAFEKMFAEAEKGMCDFVVCDWVFSYEDKGLVYVNTDRFLYTEHLEGEQCEILLEAATYFTVNKLYKRSFLMDQQIFYGEGYIYEDYEFYAETAQKANKIGIVPNPFYHVRINEYSTTKSNRRTKVHIESLIKAVEATIRKFEPRGEESYYHLYKYIMKKTMSYIRERAPIGYKRKTLKTILHILNKKNRDYYVPRNVVPLFYFFFRRKYVQNSRVNRIILVDHLHARGKLAPLFSKTMDIKARILKNRFMGHWNKKRLAKKKTKQILQHASLPIRPDIILFMGFDYRYAGNSKYLFDYMVKHNEAGHQIYFVTPDTRVPSKYSIKPRSMKFYKIISQAKVVIAESWVPLDFTKKEGQQWIQLWHGTPFKKLLFDSHEKYISRYNRNHKRLKQKDISKWDYLLADSEIGKEKFATAFAYNKDRILNYGYPRVQWLKDHRHDAGLKASIRAQLKIPAGKKVILYVPTWRDYNYKSARPDLSYMLDIPRLHSLLGDDYVFISKDHSMGHTPAKGESVIVPPAEIEVQYLILAADLIISDYSSIIFDCMAVDKPFYLFINDFERYAEARGVYEDMSEQLESYYVSDISELAERIANNAVPESFTVLKEAYSNSHTADSNKQLQQKIYELTGKEVKQLQ